jgi:hypothetical protein
MFQHDRDHFVPCVLHMIMAFGILILKFVEVNAVTGKQRKAVNRVLVVAQIRHRLGRVPSPDGQETQRLLAAWPFLAVHLGIEGGHADAAVLELGRVFSMLYHTEPPTDPSVPDRVAAAARDFRTHCAPTSGSSYLHILEHDIPWLLRRLPVGMGMFSNDLTETLNAVIKNIYLHYSSRGGGFWPRARLRRSAR